MHSHGNGHSHAEHFGTYNRAFAIAVFLNLGFVIIEAVYGVLAGSLALLADAGHNLSDVLGLLMAADTLVSVGVVIAGVVILFTDVRWIDPVVSLVIAVVIFIGTWRLLKDSVSLAVDAVPKSINPGEVLEKLKTLPGVTSAHHLHIWALSTTENALTVHLVKPDSGDDDRVIEQATHMLNHDFNIQHVTIQWERAITGCPNASGC